MVYFPFSPFSNGIGRSGVFVALHIIIERMQAEGVVDVFQTVKNLRIQRPATVQTLVRIIMCAGPKLRAAYCGEPE